MDELVQQHLHALRVVPEHARDGGVPLPRSVVVGAEDVDRTVEAAIELVHQVDDVGGAVRGRPAALGRADDHPVVLVSVRRRAQPDGAVLLVRVQPGHVAPRSRCSSSLCSAQRVEVDAEALERGLDLREHRRNRVAVQLGESQFDVLALVAVLGRLLSASPRLDGRAEALDLHAGVVVVVLALDLVPGEVEQPRDRVADTRRCGRPTTVIGPVGFAETISTWMRCLAVGPGGSEARSGAEHLAQRLAVPLARQPQVHEPWAGDLGALHLG